jgi:hypothetical protein
VQDVHLESKVVLPIGSRLSRPLRIYFKSSEPQDQIHVRILNLRNALVSEPAVQNLGNQYLVEWDGRSADTQIQQGIYIYQLEIRGHAYNGVFVIAK